MLLTNLQADFAEALWTQGPDIEGLAPAQHMLIYRNNVISTLIQAMKNTYPLTVKLLGEDFFHMTAKEYIKQYPSRSGNLHDYGEYFSCFLSEYPPVRNLIYLAEVADFEWACHRIYFSADHPALTTQSLEKFSPEQYPHLRLTLHPASKLMKCHYPILHIIKLCKNEIDTQVNLNEGGTNLLIIRRDIEVSLMSLPDSDYIFLDRLHENHSLAEATKQAMMIDSTFKLDEKLPAWIQDKTLVDCYLLRE